MTNLYDQNRRQIAVGDVLKVFHFTGARRKRHFMYKQVLAEVTLGADGARYFAVSHLTLGADEPYHEYLDGRVMAEVEIVQGLKGDLDDRPRCPQPTAAAA
jgi:hypothetical protein